MKQYTVIVAAVFLSIVATGFGSTSAAEGGAVGGNSFIENFDRLPRDRWYISDGWTNGDHQNCYWTKSNARIRSGILQLHFNEGVGRFQCAEVQTLDVFSYGTYEVRMRAPEPASGFNAAFFTYTGPYFGDPHDEIDIELLMREPAEIWLNVHVNGDGDNGVTIPEQTLSKQFNDFAFVWKRDSLEWYVNGRLLRRINDPALIPVTPQKIYASLWSSGTLTEWMGPFRYPPIPYFLEIDRIAYTKLGEACQFDESIVCVLEK